MQNDLRDLEQRWGLALQSAGFGVWDLEPGAQTVRYSPEWKAHLGYGRVDESEPTAVWRGRVHPDDLPPMLEVQRAHLEGRTPAYEIEFRLRAADGSWRWVLSRGRVVERDAQGVALRMVGTLTDVTDHREMLALRAERDRAEAASQAKSGFLSRISHELRTPLNAVLGFTQLLAHQLGQSDLAQQRRQLAQIETAGWQLAGLIDRMLDLSRADGGQIEVKSEAVALAPLWQQVVQDAAALATSRQLRVQPLAPGLSPVLQADAQRLRQVLALLLDNALRHGRPGDSVQLSAVAEGARWLLRLADTGPGIAPARLARLFEPFAAPATPGGSFGAQGLGIGLPLAQRLVQAMGGSLSVESSSAQGTTLLLALPSH